MTEQAAIAKASTERFVDVDGLRVRFLQAGSGPALVLVHGLLGYSFSWRFAIPILAERREVFAVDMPGAGFSECPAGLDGHLQAAAQRLSRFMDAAAIERCDLVGSSYGGTTALKLASSEPYRIRTLTLVSPANPWSKIGRKRLAVLRIPPVAWLFPKCARRARFLNRYFVQRMYGDPAQIAPDTIPGYSLPLTRTSTIEHAVRIAQSWREDMDKLQQEISKASQIPALILWGSKDRLVDISSSEPLSRNFKIAKTVVLPGRGHLPYEESPHEFCRPLIEFLETYSPVG